MSNESEPAGEQLTTHYLEICDPSQLKPSQCDDVEVTLIESVIPSPELNRFLYTAVGGDWKWYDRLDWDYARWMDYLDRPELQTWVLYVSGTPAGYFEIEFQSSGGDSSKDVQVMYFGLIPQFIGRGLGGHLLTAAIERGWAGGAKRVWLHTCTRDHSSALSHYKARGMTVFKTTVTQPPPAFDPGGPWSGANRPLAQDQRQ